MNAPPARGLRAACFGADAGLGARRVC